MKRCNLCIIIQEKKSEDNRADTVFGSDYHLELCKTYESTHRFKKPKQGKSKEIYTCRRDS